MNKENYYLFSRYELQFAVWDRLWQQRGISANVTVAVRYISTEVLTHAVPVTLTPVSPEQLTYGWTPQVSMNCLRLS